jgi:hypothetical protein
MTHLDIFFISCHVADVTTCKRLYHLAHIPVRLGEVSAHSAFQEILDCQTIVTCQHKLHYCVIVAVKSTAYLRDAVGGGVAAGVPATQAICPHAK